MLSRVSPNGASNHGLQQTRVRCFLGILAFPIEYASISMPELRLTLPHHHLLMIGAPFSF